MKCITQNGIGFHQTMTIIHYYRTTEPSHSLLPSIKEQLKALGLTEDADKIDAVETESCFNVLLARELDDDETKRLEWLFAETFDSEQFASREISSPCRWRIGVWSSHDLYLRLFVQLR
jgi:hypothetical protein